MRARWTLTRAKLCREAFFDADHAIIFDVIVHLADKSAGAEVSGMDLVLVGEELTRRQLFEEVGGNGTLVGIINSLAIIATAPVEELPMLAWMREKRLRTLEPGGN